MAFSSPVPQRCLLPPEIFLVKTTCIMSCDKDPFIFIFKQMALKWMWTLTSSLLVVLRIVTFGLELAGLFATFPQCTWGFRVVLEFMVWHEAERRQIWTENVCFFYEVNLIRMEYGEIGLSNEHEKKKTGSKYLLHPAPNLWFPCDLWIPQSKVIPVSRDRHTALLLLAR